MPNFRGNGRKETKAQEALRIARKNRKTLRNVVQVSTIKVAEVALTLSANPIVIVISPPTGFGGKKIKIKRLRMNLEVRSNLTSSLSDNYRVDLILDKFPDESTPNALVIYGDSSPGITELFKDSEFERFRLIQSWSGVLHKVAGPVNRMIRFDKKVGYIMQSDTNASMSIADCIKNNLFICLWTTATGMKNSSVARV